MNFPTYCAAAAAMGSGDSRLRLQEETQATGRRQKATPGSGASSCHGHAPSCHAPCAPATVGGATRPIHKQASKEEIRTIERHIHVGKRELEACLGEVRFSGLGIHLYLSALTFFPLHCRLINSLLAS